MPTDDIPSIAIIDESGADVAQHPTIRTDAAMLSPYTPRSPTSTAVDTGDDSSSMNSNIPPPSPTMSTRSSIHSVHFTNSTALRDNKPEAALGHARKPSNATFTSVSTVPDQASTSRDTSDLGHRRTIGSDTTTVVSDSKEGGQKSRKKGKREEELDQTAHQRELEQDRGVDPAPFAFRPYELAHMLDPKSLDSLRHFGGTEGILAGLGTNKDTGLSKAALAVNSGAVAHHNAKMREAEDLAKAAKGKKGKGAGKGASPRHYTESEKEPEKEREQEQDGPPVASPDVSNASVDERRRVYGPNILPTRPSKSLLQLMWLALKDKVLVLLSIAAVISLALGLFQDFGTPRPPGEAPVDWVEGVAIMVAVAIVVIVGSLNDWQKERQFKELNDKKEERGVKVIRDGAECIIDIKEVVVGDIALLEPGEIVPCDGIFLSGHNVRCDESGATGESDAIRKVTYEECLELIKRSEDGKEAPHTDCFVVSGSKVLEGVGKYVVVAVGTKSFNGRIMMALRGDAENTPLQLKLNALAELIAKIGSAAGLLLFAALMIRFFVQLGTGDPQRTPNQKGIAFVNILIISVTLIVVAVPEGLPLAVTLALAFATKRMTYEKLLVRVLGSCETMANASVVCTDKTGTLTQNVMTVVAGSVGIHCKFVRQLEDNAARHNADGKDDEDSDRPTHDASRRHRDDFSIDQAQLNDVLPEPLRELFNEAIAVNSTAFEDRDPESGEMVFVGSKTETALLQFAKELGWRSFRETRDTADVKQMIPFSSERKAMGVAVKIRTGGYRVYLKGASEILSKKCTRHVVVRPPGAEKRSAEGEIETREIGMLEEENISRTIIFYANQTLRTIALCYRDFESWPPQGMPHDEEGEVPFEALAQDLTLIGITGIEDPLRSGVRDAVAKCHRAGVTVKMCTGDNVLTARSIATQCGIFTPGGIIMEGPVFRKLNQAERVEIVPRLQVLARSSPEDKKVLVETLKSIGEIVGVTGDGTNDGPALKTANVGFSMGIAGTEVAKEASDIILMDDNFASIVKAIMWGRCVNDAVRKFLQFQISTNVTAVVITFVTAVASTEESSVLSAVQLLWINIIMDTFAALALATDPATESLLDRKPDKKTAPLFSTDMYKQILIQSIYQVTVILIFHFLGLQILGLHLVGDPQKDADTHTIVQTLVFNAFVFAQIFNSVNCRRLDKHLNIFEGIFKNRYFLAITAIEIGVQTLIVFVGGDAFQVTRIGGREWGISLALGIVSIPLGALIRLLPNGPFEALFKKLGLLGKPEVLPTASPEAEAWSGAVALVRDNLGTFANVRGGRLRSSSFVIKSRLSRLSHDNPAPLPISSLMTMVPTLIVGTIATGQKTTQTGSLSDPAGSDPSKSSAALWEGRLQLHPDTPHDDPVFQRYGAGNQHLA
ncbi:putative this magnesium-dependent enzyme catalyzes the hydrolysis of ATP coupled with the transport of calcium [Lyophyllum shimeji]|uniref:Calcium-transporting ATPase n=1 Tax=Lyophyllum shimeji TaxID=47721 RepID=A0A9P3PR02_LYOSH|nr:putative this magnesium-dependent enzyme catalyzes the hydrolysis of ATP coupled with the transport of calcium [Lyophyllum shimeji]